MNINPTEQKDATKWESILTEAEMNIAKSILKKVGTTIAPTVQRASNERYTSVDPVKDPYRLLLSIGAEIEAVVDTDGTKRVLSGYTDDNNERVQNLEIRNYNYVLTQYFRNGNLVTQNLLMKDFKVQKYYEALRSAQILN